MSRSEVSRITVTSPKITHRVTFAVAADLHNGSFQHLLPEIFEQDALLIPGDMVLRYDGGCLNALEFLSIAASRMPVFMSLGNHEVKMPGREQFLHQAKGTGAVILDNEFTMFHAIRLGGFTSGGNHAPDFAKFLRNMGEEEKVAFTLVMCHNPEYFEPYLKNTSADLTLSGHAHGGQIRLFGRGIYAPGQGIMPKLTSGFYFGERLLVSRGLTNTVPVPRFNNPTQLIMLTLANPPQS